MPLKKVKPDPRFSGTKASVATARGTSVKSKQQVNAQRAPSEWDKRIEANKAKLAATPDFKADTIASNELIGNQNTYTADTPANKFWKTKLGTAISGIWAGLGFQAPPAGRELGSMPSEYVAGTVLGAGAQIASFGTMINPLKATAVTTLDKVGTLNYAWKMGQSGKVTLSSAGSFATNAMTKANTASWLSELATFATKPATVVGTLMASIGSYPFAGFIREEAIQVIGWAVSTALRNNDVEGAKVAQEAMKEALDPGLQDQIMAKIPFVNVLNELEGFFDGARINVAVNDKAIENMEFGVDAAQQQADQDNATVDYYNSERIKMLKWQREAEIQGRNEDAAFWAKERAKQRKLEEEDRKAIADFWFAYKKRLQELYEESRPSNLKFGLL